MSKQIEDLLKILTLFAVEPDAHKVLEYLLRRYRVHEMDVGPVLRAFVHLHDAKVVLSLHSTFDHGHRYSHA